MGKVIRTIDGNKVVDPSHVTQVMVIERDKNYAGERGDKRPSESYVVRGPMRYLGGETREIVAMSLDFHEGKPPAEGLNGWLIEDLVLVLIDRLAQHQMGPFACEENAEALDGFKRAWDAMCRRRVRRIEQGTSATQTVEKGLQAIFAYRAGEVMREVASGQAGLVGRLESEARARLDATFGEQLNAAAMETAAKKFAKQNQTESDRIRAEDDAALREAVRQSKEDQAAIDEGLKDAEVFLERIELAPSKQELARALRQFQTSIRTIQGAYQRQNFKAEAPRAAVALLVQRCELAMRLHALGALPNVAPWVERAAVGAKSPTPDKTGTRIIEKAEWNVEKPAGEAAKIERMTHEQARDMIEAADALTQAQSMAVRCAFSAPVLNEGEEPSERAVNCAACRTLGLWLGTVPRPSVDAITCDKCQTKAAFVLTGEGAEEADALVESTMNAEKPRAGCVPMGEDLRAAHPDNLPERMNYETDAQYKRRTARVIDDRRATPVYMQTDTPEWIQAGGRKSVWDAEDMYPLWMESRFHRGAI